MLQLITSQAVVGSPRLHPRNNLVRQIAQSPCCYACLLPLCMHCVIVVLLFYCCWMDCLDIFLVVLHYRYALGITVCIGGTTGCAAGLRIDAC